MPQAPTCQQEEILPLHPNRPILTPTISPQLPGFLAANGPPQAGNPRAPPRQPFASDCHIELARIGFGFCWPVGGAVFPGEIVPLAKKECLANGPDQQA
ncbi:MAG: hypothetical protein DWH82_00180 [Planctomycetota bacterium]|nr:MAG: hypothetical protein DWH82_00180 [Planctomycetota bacterium]